MFAKKARSLNLSRSFGLRRNAAAARPRNDNRTNANSPAPPGGPVPPKPRPGLFGRWHLTPAGQIECSWARRVDACGGRAVKLVAGGAAPFEPGGDRAALQHVAGKLHS